MSAKKKTLISLALCMALIVLVFISGVLDRQKTWVEMVWSGLDFPAGTSRDLSAGDAYGVINGGPGLTLPAGRYRVKWMIEADGANSIEITTDNGAAALPARIATSADLVTDEHVFELKETAENVQLRVHFESGTRINVIDMRLYSPMYRDHAFTFAFLLLGAWLLYYPIGRADGLGHEIGMEDDKTAHFELALLDERLRGRGMHGKMVDKLTAHCAADGRFTHMLMTAHPDNMASLGAFLNRGYTVAATKTLYGGVRRSIAVKALQDK